MRQSVPQIVGETCVTVGTNTMTFNGVQVASIILAKPRYALFVTGRPAEQLELLRFARVMNAISDNLDPIWKIVFGVSIQILVWWLRGFENHVRVGATKTERVDASSANTFRPFSGLGDDLRLTA